MLKLSYHHSTSTTDVENGVAPIKLPSLFEHLLHRNFFVIIVTASTYYYTVILSKTQVNPYFLQLKINKFKKNFAREHWVPFF